MRRLYSSSIRNGEIASSPHVLTASKDGKYSFLTDNKAVRASGSLLREGGFQRRTVQKGTSLTNTDIKPRQGTANAAP